MSSVDLQEVKKFFDDLKKVKSSISSETIKQINKKSILEKAEELSNMWFGKYKEAIISYSILSPEKLDKYDNTFKHLLKLSSSKGNKKESFLSDLKELTLHFKDDIIIKLQTNGKQNTSINGELEKLLNEVKDPEKNEYLHEAISCAKSDYKRASVVLGWCAAIDHIHKKIEDSGFINFNITSVKIAGENQGRFKRFNKTFNVQSLSDLRTVFDDDILWVIEGMQLIDSNQHTRLRACFDMRNQCGHPGEAPITSYNLMSFFSDINEILFKNSKFDTK